MENTTRPVYMTCRLLFGVKLTLTFSIGKSMVKILHSCDDGTIGSRGPRRT